MENLLLSFLMALSLEYDVQLAYIPNMNSWIYTVKDSNWCKNTDVYVSDLGAGLNIRGFFIGGSVRTYSGIADDVDFAWWMPMNAYYSFKTGFKYKKINVRYEHLCHHAICPTPINRIVAQINGAYNMFSIEIKSDFKLFD